MDNYFETVFFCLSYFLFFGLLIIGKAKKSNRLVGDFQLATNFGFLEKLQVVGIAVFGAAPFLYTDVISFGASQLSAYSGSVILVIGIATLYFSIQMSRKDFSKTAAYLIKKSLPQNTLLHYFLLRVLFICSYEMWFRGFFLNKLIESYDLGIAVVINVFFYALQHTVNGKRETTSCISFGVLLCLLSIWSGSVLPAIFIHLCLTLGYELQFVLLARLKIIDSYEHLPHRSFGIPGQ